MAFSSLLFSDILLMDDSYPFSILKKGLFYLVLI